MLWQWHTVYLIGHCAGPRSVLSSLLFQLCILLFAGGIAGLCACTEHANCQPVKTEEVMSCADTGSVHSGGTNPAIRLCQTTSPFSSACRLNMLTHRKARIVQHSCTLVSVHNQSQPHTQRYQAGSDRNTQTMWHVKHPLDRKVYLFCHSSASMWGPSLLWRLLLFLQLELSQITLTGRQSSGSCDLNLH